jgi:hypothetical protein
MNPLDLLLWAWAAVMCAVALGVVFAVGWIIYIALANNP